MSLTVQRASTPDSSGGVQVALAAAEVGSGVVQAVAIVFNKTTWGETSRTGITSSDAPTGGDMTTTGFAGSSGASLFDIENAGAIALRATCTLPSKTLTGRLAYYSGSNVCIGLSKTLTFSSDGTLRMGNASGDYLCASLDQLLLDAGAARKARFFVDSVSGGTWSVYARPI